MANTIEIKDAGKALELVLGVDPSQHYIKVNGKAWNCVKSVDIGVEKEEPHDTVMTFSCYFDGAQDFVGNLTPMGERRSIYVQLRMNGRMSRCMFDGKSIRLTTAKLWADASESTMLGVEYTTFDGDTGYPESNIVTGVFVPNGEQKIEAFPPFE